MHGIQDMPTDIWFTVAQFCAEGLGRWYELQRVSKGFAERVKKTLRHFTVTLDRPVLVTNLQSFQPEVRVLKLRASTRLGLRCLHHLSHLRELHIITNTSSLDVLEPLTRLQIASLKWQSLRLIDLTPLSRLPKLRSLSLKNCRVWSGCLRTLTRLHSLKIANCQLTNVNIQDLSSLSKLEHLDFQLVNWCDVSPLKKLNLRSLKASGFDVSQICNPRLEILDMSRSHVGDLRWLSTLTQLRVLDVSRCTNILDVGALRHLKHLTDIYAKDTKFTVVSYFSLSPRVKFHF
jgi:Leucine-rich repeat (LRR) protein